MKYYVDISPEIVLELQKNDNARPIHWHLVSKVERPGPQFYERWLVEDGGAQDSTIENCLVEVYLHKRLGDPRAIIFDRKILQRNVFNG